MQSVHDLKTITDDELLRRLAALLAASRLSEADLVAHIGEVDARRLYLRQATSSTFVYCTKRLHLSEAEACLRIAAARASRDHPVILEMLADGRLHLSAVAKLAAHLTLENRDELLARAAHKTKREIDELVAEVAPRPDVPNVIRKRPAGRIVARPVEQRLGVRFATGKPNEEVRPERVDSGRLDVVGGRGSALTTHAAIGPRPETESTSESEGRTHADTRSPSCARSDTGLPWVAARSRPAVVEPLAPSRYKVQFTASAELRDKLERLQRLMRSSIPDGDLAAVIEAAVTEKLERLEARRFGRTKSPQVTVHARHLAPDPPRAGRGQAGGPRAGRRPLPGRHPWALGGDHSPDNVSSLCSAHNRLMAEFDYGRSAVDKGRLSTADAPVTQLKLNTG